MKDVQFEQTREAVQSKQRDLKRKGKCQFKHAGSDKQQKMKSRVFTSVFQILNFRRTISTYFQDVLFYSN